jgi:hypothetical protein
MTVLFALVLMLLPGLVSAADPPCLTAEPAFITLAVAGSVTPIISSGETCDGLLFPGLPDGIGLAPGTGGAGTVDVYVAHEETHVPFFGTADFQDASASRLTLDVVSGEVLSADVAIGPEAGYLRFCSASMAGPAEGFSRYTFFTGEESNDIVDVPAGAPYGPDPAISPQRQAGYAVALDVASGQFIQVEGMGRLNHENTIAVPGGWSRINLLTTDDTFSGPSAQLYQYLANHESHIWQDKGSLWAFRVTRTDEGSIDPNDPFNGANDYLDLQPGDDWQGEFIRVPKKIAKGLTGHAPQTALENWSNEHNVFQFIRLEDMAYDKNHPRVVYIADTGRSRVVPDPGTGRMMRGPGGTVGQADNGRIFKMVFNRANPRKVDSFSVFADGDATSADEFVAMTSPDNMDTSANSLMVQEDTGNAKIWWYDFNTTTWSVAATVNDPSGESSGIVDASEWFGPGSWVLDVQGHGVNVEEQVQPDGTLLKRESGQVMVMNIPGS